MYGHSLPQRGQWVLALRQFKKADKIHLKWAKANQVEPQQDWHYSHNLDLMAATYMGMGDFKKALDTWERAFNFDSRAVLHSLSLFLVPLSHNQFQFSCDLSIVSQLSRAYLVKGVCILAK